MAEGSSGSRSVRPNPVTFVIEWLRANREVLALLFPASGLLLYVTLRLTYSAFYGQLGVKPEDVGLGYGELVAQSVIGLVVLYVAVLCGLVLVGLSILSEAEDDSDDDALESVNLIVFILGLGGAVAFIFTIAFLLPVLGSYWRFLAFLKGLEDFRGFALAVTLFIIATALYSRYRQWIPRHTVHVVLAFLVVGGFCTFGLLFYFGLADGAAVARGEARHGVILGLPLLVSWGADPADVYWPSTAPDGLVSRTSHCLMYLGQSNGTVILYDARSHDVIRVPAASATIEIHPDRAKC